MREEKVIISDVLIDMVDEFFTKNEVMSEIDWTEILSIAESETSNRMM